jgi:hypothetical protein
MVLSLRLFFQDAGRAAKARRRTRRNEGATPMTDFELTKLCWEALSGVAMDPDSNTAGIFDPLHDDAQAMALDGYIMEQRYCISMDREECDIYPMENYSKRPVFSFRLDFTKPENRRRIRVECVAKMQSASIIETPK